MSPTLFDRRTSDPSFILLPNSRVQDTLFPSVVFLRWCVQLYRLNCDDVLFLGFRMPVARRRAEFTQFPMHRTCLQVAAYSRFIPSRTALHSQT